MYRRPEPLYVCFRRSTAAFDHLSTGDDSDSTYRCIKASDLISITKWTYYAAKVLQLAKTLPMPP